VKKREATVQNQEHPVLFRGYVKKENGNWVAVCVDLNIVAQATSADEAVKDCFELVKEYLDYVCSTYPNQIAEYIPRSAPHELIEEYYAILAQVIGSKKPVRNRRLYDFPIKRQELSHCHVS